MPTIHDEAWNGHLTSPALKNYVSSDRSIIDRPGGIKNITPLAAACWRGHLEVVKVLLAGGANPNALSSSSRTPLYFVTTQAPSSVRFDILRVLIDAKVNIDMPCDKDGNTPLMNALSQARDGRVGETAEALAEKRGMKRHLRTKAERNSTLAQVVDLAVSSVLLVVSYTNTRGLFKSVLRGVAKKFKYNTSRAEDPNLVKEIPKPSTLNEFMTNLNNYVKDGKLKKFFAPNDPFLQKLAAKAHALHEDHTTDLSDPKNLMHLTRLAFYRPVIFCDDSGSMESDDRFQNQLALVSRIARIATRIVPDDEAGVDLRFINAAGSDRLNANALEQAIKAVTPKGGTPIGTNLRSKILEPLVYNVISAGTLKRPILVCIITDGSPSGELPDVFVKAILECQRKLTEAGYDPESVKFLVSQIGSDEFARDFLESLRMERGIRTVLHCTTDRLDDKFRELKEKEDMLDLWLLKLLTKPLYDRHEE
ncbi:hypothetical protein F5887DRAFT_1077054 [Amanita rubescens]|nr:hypothetical protein F5887DRAFT_1077054 [Amanita rubescens]